MQTLLLSGGSSGIGLATARHFSHCGWRVFELSRNGKSYQDGKGEVIHFDCDICNAEQVDEVVSKVLVLTDHIDVVLSNAGFGISGAIEFTADADARQQMEVNFLGAHHLIRAILPQLRKQHNGRIIFTSSVAAILSIPYQAFYSASKAAINAYALALQNEIREFGISVSVFMPGDVATGFTTARKKNEVGNTIYTHVHKAVSAMEKDEQQGMSPSQMARRIYAIATTACPRPQYVGGFKYKIFCILDRILPKRLVNWIISCCYC